MPDQRYFMKNSNVKDASLWETIEYIYSSVVMNWT